MLLDLFLRAYARFVSLPVLGPLLDGSLSGSPDEGSASSPSAGASARHPRLRSCSCSRGLSDLGQVGKPNFLDATCLPCLVRSLADFLEERAALEFIAVTLGGCLSENARAGSRAQTSAPGRGVMWSSC